MVHKKKLAGRLVRSMCLVWLLLLCPSCDSGADGSQSGVSDPPEEGLEESVPDTEGPVISGARDLTVVITEPEEPESEEPAAEAVSESPEEPAAGTPPAPASAAQPEDQEEEQ